MHMPSRLTAALLLLAPSAAAQTYFYVDQIQVAPPAPTTSDPIALSFIGNFSGGGVYITSVTHQVIGSMVNVQINCADLGGITVLIPHTEVVNIGTLTAGTYTIQLTGTGVWDMAPVPQHTFTVTGGPPPPPCDSVVIHSLTWSAFDADHVELHVDNQSGYFYNYPGFILYDANGDTLAKEVVNLFGLVGDSWHALALHPGATVPTGTFTGTLELWSLFYSEFNCSWPVNIDLCPPAPCVPLYPMVQNVGGALVVTSFPWSLFDENNTAVANGVFELTPTEQQDLDTLCVPPGEYHLVSYLTTPAGGMLQFGAMATVSSVVTETLVQDSQPDTAFFTFYERCIDGGNGLPSSTTGRLVVAPWGNGWIVRVPDHVAMQLMEVWTVQGALVHTQRIEGSWIRIDGSSLTNGLYLLRGLATDGTTWTGKALLAR